MPDTASHNVLIVGAGQIGAFYDTPACTDILTHAHAFSAMEGFRLLGFVDANPAQAQAAANRWGVQAFTSIEEAFNASAIDVVSVAVPDLAHTEVLAQLAEFPVKLIFAEKPFTTDVNEAKALQALFTERGIATQVNYSRGFVPEFIALKESIQANAFGQLLSGAAYYGKGFIHNGSHLIHLLQSFFGKLFTQNIHGVFEDFASHDPSLSLTLTTQEDAPIVLQAVDSRQLSIFELDLLFERQRVRVIDSGFAVEYYDVEENQRFQGYKNYRHSRTVQTQLGSAMRFAVENIRNHLQENKPLISPLDQALAILQTLDEARRLKNGAICATR